MSLTNQPAADRHAARRGQTLVLFSLFLVVLIGSAALTIDYGTWLKSKRDYQNAADTAALQGATFLVKPISSTKEGQARLAAWNSLNRQLNLGVSSGIITGWAGVNNTVAQTSGGYRMWVSTSPNGAGAKYPGAQGTNTSAMFVYVEKDGSSFLGSIFGQGNPNVGAWATAAAGPNRFAVITLRKNGDPTNGNPTDIDVNGGTVLKVIDGDLGGNWGMSINGSGSKIQFSSLTLSDTYGPYLTENVPTGGNGWTPSQVVDASNTPVPVNYVPEVPDPNYPAPCLTYTGLNPCLVDRAVAGFPPDATTSRSVDTCPVGALVDRLPSGRYNNIKIPNGTCLVLDPLLLPVAGKYNGIYYITGTLDINNSGLLIGNGVTLIFARGANLNMNAGASISLNSGLGFGGSSCGIVQCKYGAWTSKGGYQWSTGLAPTYNGAPADPFAKGMAMYVCKSTASCDSGGSPSTNIVQLSSGSGLDYLGLVYAPYDNVKFSGQPTHKDIGQLVAWTVMFTGGVEIDQTYAGPDSGTPFLIEPNTSQ